MRTHSNIALMPGRRLPQIFGDATQDAVTNANPNTLNNNLPSVKDAMGISGDQGVVSGFHDYVASDPDLTIYFWSQALNEFNPAQGWVKASEAASGHTKTVPGFCLFTFTVPESTPFFIQSSVANAPRNLWLTGTRAKQNPNADMVRNAPNDT